MAKNIEDFVQDGGNKVTNAIKSRMFDFIAVGIVMAMLALNLGVLELRDITLTELCNIFLECIPFFITSVLLSVNFYHKGTFTGKKTENFKSTLRAYSDIVVKLQGKQIDMLPDFCNEYNDRALKQLQENLLKRAAITYDRFNNETTDADNKILKPLKIMSKEELETMYNKEQVGLILKAKKCKIKGICSNVLLGNTPVEDNTDFGDDEKEMDKKNTGKSAIVFLISTLFLSFIGVRDVLQWGWAGLLLTAFKLIYSVCASCMKHFKGYNDITIKLSNHIARKTDVLKQYLYWYSNKTNNVSKIENAEGNNN